MIIQCHELCMESYKDSSTLFKEVDDLNYGCILIDDVLYLVFRGTANIENVIRDARIFPRETFKGYFAHSGFVTGYKKLWPIIEKEISIIPYKEIVCTGHSLGGAIATLFAERLECNLVTFGSPKVYFRFTGVPKLMHDRLYRDDDPVPMLLGVCYKHTNGGIKVKDGDSELIDVSDHSIETYLPKEFKGDN